MIDKKWFTNMQVIDVNNLACLIDETDISYEEHDNTMDILGEVMMDFEWYHYDYILVKRNDLIEMIENSCQGTDDGNVLIDAITEMMEEDDMVALHD